MRRVILPVGIAILLFIIPFGWLKPGEMDLGGDSSRLYFYDPVAYLKNYALFGVSPSGFGAENIGYFAIPLVAVLAIMLWFIHSPTLVISAFHGMSISLAFLFVYGIVKELTNDQAKDKDETSPPSTSFQAGYPSLQRFHASEAYPPSLLRSYGRGAPAFHPHRQRWGIQAKGHKWSESAAILSGLLYVFSPMSIRGWDKVLMTHNYVFLNPLMFYLLLRYFQTSRVGYLFLGLGVTFLFSANFSYAAAPVFFSFYPISLMFLLLYRRWVKASPIIWKHLAVGALGFLGLQAFHLLPQLISMLSPGSSLYASIFSPEGKFDRGLGYFTAIAPSIKTSLNLMLLPQGAKDLLPLSVFSVISAVIILGFLTNAASKRGKMLVLTGTAWFVALFFSTANITQLGFNFYKALFNLPGFAIFRNFYGQWAASLLFYTVLLFGQALYLILGRFGQIRLFFLSSFSALLVVTAWPFINGTLVNPVIWQSKNVRVAGKIDPDYEQAIRFLAQLPPDGKILTLPLTDPGYQIVAGPNGGSYEGPSTVAYLAGKQDFAGFTELGRFQELILDLVRGKEYTQLKKVLGFLNVRYVFYNADPRVYDLFPQFPYQHVRQFFPPTQASYRAFLSELSLKLVKSFAGRYFIYQLDDQDVLPLFYVAGWKSFYLQEIFDWSIPLSFYDDNRKFPAIIEVGNPLANGDDFRLMVAPTSVFPQVVKNPTPPRVLYQPFPTRMPGSLLYPAVVLKEKFMLRRHGDFAYPYLIDWRFLLSAKRVAELERWGNDLPVLGTVSDIADLKRGFPEPKLWATPTKIWDLSAWMNLGSWEALLARYVRYWEDNLAAIAGANEKLAWKIKQKFLVNEYLLAHRAKLAGLIPSLTKPAEERVYLARLVDLVFDYLPTELNFRLDYPISLEYRLDQETLTPNDFELYLNRGSVGVGRADQLHWQLNHLTLTPIKEEHPSAWWRYRVPAGKLQEDPSLKLVLGNQNNLMRQAQRISSEKVEQVIATAETLSLSVAAPMAKNQTGLLWQISAWRPDSLYLLTFDYLTDGAPFNLVVADVETGQNPAANLSPLVANHLQSRRWLPYQAVIRSSRFANVAYIQVNSGLSWGSPAKIVLKNLSLYHLPQSAIVLKEVSPPSQSVELQDLPRLTFTKENPTRYRVRVEGVNRPYFLVFNQAFNERWRLYQKESRGGWVILKPWWQKPLAADRHYLVNSAVNGWYLVPEDVPGRDWELYVEMTTQRYFYVGALVSLATIVSLGLFSFLKMRS